MQKIFSIKIIAQIFIFSQDEHDLRSGGYDKTPDVKLDVPIAVNGSVVNWIESKALFGDDENHTAYLNEQLWSYWNRWAQVLCLHFLSRQQITYMYAILFLLKRHLVQ